ncbi:PhoH family protein [Robbsia sp. Bb-Pol-6]|uniref:PhoH family protein n=1 Tax=Robbsia betulipollinis TaxID=2981849 RepID=A0ABT3ZIM2_9BURK|nr:PhoH family protein [Robbsia betulipollinis]MCY0386356.1 PhoH family protein [Robbsia betulipollinis]
MPLPTLPSKLGDLLPADQYKARARPTKTAKKTAAETLVDTPAASDASIEYLPSASAELAGIAAPASMPPALQDLVAPATQASDATAVAQPDRGARPPARKQRTAALLQQQTPAPTAPAAGAAAADAAAADAAAAAAVPVPAVAATPTAAAPTDARQQRRQPDARPAAPRPAQVATPGGAANSAAQPAPSVVPDTPVRTALDDKLAQRLPQHGRDAPRGDARETREARDAQRPAQRHGQQPGGRAGAAPRTAPPPVRAKLFVLDTNVLLHDPSCLFRFEEHDIYLPMMTLEELDNNKKGMSEVARNARQVSRLLDGLVAGGADIQAGLQLSRLGNREAGGRLFFQTTLQRIDPVEGLPAGKADNQILGVVRALTRERPDREVVLVSKDINMRIKAHALQLPAEDYFNDQVLEDKDLLYTGVLALQADFWMRHAKGMESWQDVRTGTTYYRVTGPSVASMLVNQFVYLETSNGEPAFHAIVREVNGRTALLQTLRDYSHNKNNVWGVTARNREQNFALNLLMNPEVDFVSLLGQAGTGKTLLALAAGLAQVLDDKRYNEIIVTRATVPVGEDIGFLPGTEEEKMQPWMGAFDDNLEVLQKSDDSAGEWGRAATQDLVRSRLKVKSMNFMRGRTFVDKYVIIDEAQNLTPKQMKTLVTRAGPGTKLVCLGNIAQIDTPYLTEGSSGITYVVDRFKGWPHGGHITLARGERSRLADYASEIL